MRAKPRAVVGFRFPVRFVIFGQRLFRSCRGAGSVALLDVGVPLFLHGGGSFCSLVLDQLGLGGVGAYGWVLGCLRFVSELAMAEALFVSIVARYWDVFRIHSMGTRDKVCKITAILTRKGPVVGVLGVHSPYSASRRSKTGVYDAPRGVFISGLTRRGGCVHLE